MGYKWLVLVQGFKNVVQEPVFMLKMDLLDLKLPHFCPKKLDLPVPVFLLKAQRRCKGRTRCIYSEIACKNWLNCYSTMKNNWFILLPMWVVLPWQPIVPAQPSEKIYFRNPSFEDAPRASASPVGWHSTATGSTPDILPGAWGIEFAPKDGKTCVGLVTRSDGSSENIAQALAEPLTSGACYTFSMYLAHVEKYVGFNHPTRIRVWGSATKGEKGSLLAASPLINHSDWRLYKFQFFTPGTIRYLTFEAWYGPGTTFKYNGNIVLDLCSPIEKCARA
jgi:hypothetical protein